MTAVRKITLVYPGIVNVGFASFGKGGMDRNWMNLGILYLAASLKRESFEVEVIDLRSLSGWDAYADRIANNGSQAVGVYVNTPNYVAGLKACELAKGLGKTVIAGGPHATTAPESLTGSGFVDYVIKGEGERSLVELLNGLNSGIRPSANIIEGLLTENLDDLPFPDRSLYDVRTAISPVNNFPFLDNGLVIMCSRGCPFHCAFCQPLARKMFGNRVRFRSPSNVLAELKELVKGYGVKYISFQDDTFTVRKKWVLELCGLILESNLKIQWSAQSRVDTLDEEMLAAMKKAGCVCLFFGFESGSQKILDFLNKGITPEQSVKAAKLCKKYGIVMLADIMMGIPTETGEDLDKTLGLVKEIRPELLSIAYFTPIIGSDLYEYCKKENIVLINSYEDYARNATEAKKVAGIDYALVNAYKAKAERFVTLWYQSLPFASYAFKRWFNLFLKGYWTEIIKEIFYFTALPYPFNGLRLKNRLYKIFNPPGKDGN